MAFIRLEPLPHDDAAELFFEDRPLRFAQGETVGGALLAAGIDTFRQTPVSGAERGPWCLMGVCFECLVSIDGVENQRACMKPARPGMQVRRQTGARNDAAAVGGDA